MIKSNRLHTIVFLSLLSVTFLLIGIHKIHQAVDPSFEDTGSFLEGALFIKEHGGVLSFIKLCLTGEYQIANQHPLYLLFLTPFATRNLSFFPEAQLATLLLGLTDVILLFLIARNLFGETTAKIASVLLVFNMAFLERSSNVDCEPLLILFVLLAWFFMVKGGEDHRFWGWSGVASGLAYMAKGPAILLIPIFAISTVFLYKWKVVKIKYFWLFFVAFVVASSPLITRNLIVYGTPTYETLNSHMFWINNLREVSDKYSLSLNWHLHTFVTTPMPTLFTYLQTHSFSEILKRALHGVAGESLLLLNGLDMVIIRSPSLSLIMSFFLSILFLFGLVKDPDKRRVVYTLMAIAIFFVPFSWLYQVVNGGIRYQTPLLPLILAYSAFGCVELVKEIDARVLSKFSRFNLYRAVPYILMLLLFPVAAYAAATKNITPLVHPVDLPDDERELMDWFRDNVKEDDVVIFRPTVRYWGALWYADFKGTVDMISRHSPLPEMDLSEFRELLKKRKISLIVLHKENYESPPVLKEYFEYSDNVGLVEKKPMEGWRRVYASRNRPTPFLVYRIDRDSPQDFREVH